MLNYILLLSRVKLEMTSHVVVLLNSLNIFDWVQIMLNHLYYH